MKKLVLIHILFGLVTSLQAQITLIPDANFENFLIQQGIDSDGIINGQVLTSDVDIVTVLAFWPNSIIEDLTGIEDFSALETIVIPGMNITTLNLTQNTNLNTLNFGETNINELDLSQNSNLEHLFFGENPNLTYLDVSQNTLLYDFYCSYCFVTKIDLSQNLNLKNVEIKGNKDITSINLLNGANTDIAFLRIQNNTTLGCVQVDDPEAVIAGVDPPYDNWVIENNPIISEDCFLGLEDYGQKGVVLYPNPVKDVLSIESATHIKKVKIYTMFGLLVKEVTANFKEISLAELPTGLLVVEISTEKGGSIEKIVKE